MTTTFYRRPHPYNEKCDCAVCADIHVRLAEVRAIYGEDDGS